MSETTFYKRYWMDQHIKKNPFDIHPGTWADENFNYHMDAFKAYLSGIVLDFGCGDGQFARRVLPYCDRVHGVDVCDIAIRKAGVEAPDIDFKVIEERLPFPDCHFDAICAIDVMEHILDTETVLKEFNRVLKPGGVVLIATNELTRLKLLIIALRYHNTYFYPASPHIRYFTKDSLADLLSLKGFRVVQYQKNRVYLGFIPAGQFVVARKDK